MEMMKLMEERHSVRQYEDKRIEDEKRKVLAEQIEKMNRENGLHVQIFFDEPKCFDSLMAHYGKFTGVQNYIALVGKKGSSLEEMCGYCGEQLVLLAQSLGLNTCWVAMTHGKSAAAIESGEKQACLIALGYGKTQGVAHTSKPMDKLVKANENIPEWFEEGMKAVMLAPTAMNQQKFVFTLNGDQVFAKVSGPAFYTKMDLGIVKYHFVAVTGKKVD